MKKLLLLISLCLPLALSGQFRDVDANRVFIKDVLQLNNQQVTAITQGDTLATVDYVQGFSFDTANFAFSADSARAASTAEASQGNFVGGGNVSGDTAIFNHVSVGGGEIGYELANTGNYTTPVLIDSFDTSEGWTFTNNHSITGGQLVITANGSSTKDLGDLSGVDSVIVVFDFSGTGCVAISVIVGGNSSYLVSVNPSLGSPQSIKIRKGDVNNELRMLSGTGCNVAINSIEIYSDVNDYITFDKPIKANLQQGLSPANVYYNEATGELVQSGHPHVFLFNEPNGTLTQSVGTSWTTFLPDTAFFQFVGKKLLDSIGNDTIGLHFQGHYRSNGGVSIAGANNVWVESRLFNVTQDKAITGVGSVTMTAPGNRVNLPIRSYCTFCKTGDKVILQWRAENTQTITIYGGDIWLEFNHATSNIIIE
jgi:hypothetical protein